MNRFSFLILFLLAAACTGASAQGFGGKLKKLLGRDGAETALDAAQWPAPYAVEGAAVLLADTLDLGAADAEGTFVRALLAVIGQGEEGQRNLTALDVEGRAFATVLAVGGDEAGSKAPCYTCRLRLVALGKRLAVRADSICLVSANFFGEKHATPFEHLNLEKPRTQQQLQEFATLCGRFVQALRPAGGVEPQPVTHWDDIAAGRIVRGMNETECMLAAGRPLHVRTSPTRTRWMMAGNATVVFEGGVVTRVSR